MTTTPFGLPDNDTSDVLFAFTDAAGNPALAPAIDPGSVIATASDPTVLFVIPNADLSGVTVSAEGPLTKDVTVDVSFTVAGVKWSGSEDFEVDASGPTTLTLVPQTPVAETPPAPAPVAATTTAVASPESGASASGSQVAVTTNSTGAVTYSIDTANSTAPSPAVSSTGAVSANGPGNVVVDVAVAADAQFEASNASVTIDFTS